MKNLVVFSALMYVVVAKSTVPAVENKGNKDNSDDRGPRTNNVRHVGAAEIVAFSAARISNMDHPEGSGDVIIDYDSIDLNAGAAFNGFTFVAPYEGVYHFQFSLKGSGAAIHLKINGIVRRSTITNVVGDYTGNSNSNSITLLLNPGDYVETYQADWSSGLVNESPTNGVFTSFNGYLVQRTI